MVFETSLRFVQNTEDAEDITQEVFVRVYEHLRKFTSESAALRTWIYKITINTSLDVVRAKRRKKRYGNVLNISSDENDKPPLEPSHNQNPYTMLEEKEVAGIALSALKDLPCKQRVAILMSRLDQKSYKEISEKLDISIKAVESLIQRARITLITKACGTDKNDRN